MREILFRGQMKFGDSKEWVYGVPTIGFSEGTNYMSVIGNIHNKAELLGGDGK